VPYQRGCFRPSTAGSIEQRALSGVRCALLPCLSARLPAGFHRIRYYGLLASGQRANNIARARELLAVPMLPIDAIKTTSTEANEPQTPRHPCPCCGGRMIIIEIFERGRAPRYRPPAPTVAIRIDTS
jgi:hypothetical protein